MKINRFLWGMIAALAVIVSGCDDDDEENLGVPSISASESSLSFSQDGGATNAQTIVITSSRDWTASADEDWVIVSPTSGSAASGTTNVTVYVEANTSNDRTAKITFATSTVSTTVSVSQSGPSGSIEGTYVYYNDFDAEAATQEYGSSGSSWPYLDQFDGWKNESGTGIEDVAYSYTNLSVRSNSSSNGTYSVYDGSGTNNLFFGSVTNYFVIYDIELTSGVVDYTLSFGSERYEYGVSDNTFNHDEFHVYVSEDGSRWVELSYTFASGDQSAKWDLASTTFTVSSSVENLCIYFTADVASAYRLDDVILATSSESGTTIDFSTGVKLGGDTSGGDSDYDEGTLGYILDQASGTSVTATGVVMGINTRGFVIADDTANALVYNTSEYTAVDGLEIGDEVTVVGTIGSYGIPEIYITSNADDVTINSSRNAVTYPEPTVITADNIATYAGKWGSCDYIQFTGTLAISGYYYNVTIDGTSVLGSISNPTDDLNISNYTGVSATYTGYYAGGTSTYYLNMLAVFIDSGSSYLNLSSTSLTAHYAGGDVTFDISSDLDWTVTTSDEANFSVSPTSGTGNSTVTVTCTANTGSEREATITVSSSAGDKTVTITQLAPPSGDAVYYEKVTATPSDWAGKYLIVYDDGPYAFDGSRTTLDAAGNYQEVTITDYGIESTTTTDAMQFSIWSDGSNGYYIKSASGYYIYSTSTDNKLLSSTTAIGGNTLSYDSGSGITIASTAGTILQFYSSGSNSRFRFYGTSQKAITLYKIPGSEDEVGDDAGGDTYTLFGAGTAEDPYNVADALYLTNNNLYTSDYVYVKGLISEISSVDTSSGEATYYISDDGTTDDQFYIYRGYYLGDTKFTSEDQIAVLDEVIIYGKLTMYYSTPEMPSGSYIYSLNGETEVDSGDSTVSGTIAEILAADSGSTVSTTGVVVASYKRGFVLSDGTANVLCYNTSTSGFESGTNVTITGSLSSYGNLPQIAYSDDDVTTNSTGNEVTYPEPTVITADNIATYAGVWDSCDYIQFEGTLAVSGSYYNVTIDDTFVKGSIAYPSQDLTDYSGVKATYTGYFAGGSSSFYLNMLLVEVEASDDAGGDTYTLSGAGTAEDPYTVADALYLTNNNLCTSDSVYVKGIISEISSVDTSSGEATYYISDDGTTDDQFYIYLGYYLGKSKFTSEDQIAVGDEVIVYGVLALYSSSIPEMIYGNNIYSLNGETEVDSGDSTVSGTIAEILAADSGSTVSTTGVVVASYKRGFVLSDDTANVLCYNTSTSGFESGTNVTITGTLSSYGNLPQIAYSDDDVTTNSTGNEVTYPEPTVITADNIATYAGKWDSCDYIQFEGTLAVSGSYYNVTIDDTSVKGSISYPSQDLTDYSGVKATYTGYFAGGSSASYLNMLLVKVEASDDTGGDTYTLSGAGTAEDPYTVADALYLVNNGLTPSDNVFVKGVVTSVSSYNSSYNSLSYYIADSASDESTLYVYSGYGLGGAKFSSKSDLSAGDEVVVYGALTLYGSVVEINYNNYLYSLNGETDYLTVSSSEISVAAEAGSTATFDISSNESWTVSITGSDFTLSATSGTGDATITVTAVADNTSSASITATITVTGTTSNVERSVTVTQPTSVMPTFDSNVDWSESTTTANSSYSEKATINGESVSVLKIGKSSAAGTASFTIPTGSTSMSFYAVAWTGKEATLSMTVGETSYTQAVSANSGATGSSPYTITATTDDYYTITFDAALTEETTVTVTTTSSVRVILWGINYATE